MDVKVIENFSVYGKKNKMGPVDQVGGGNGGFVTPSARDKDPGNTAAEVIDKSGVNTPANFHPSGNSLVVCLLADISGTILLCYIQ